MELHHDGRLLVVLPGDGAEASCRRRWREATRELGARIRIAANARGKLDLLDAPGTVQDLRDSVEGMSARSEASARQQERARPAWCGD